MILKSPEIQIDQDDPFKYDELGRKESAEALTEFVLSSDNSLVVSLDAPWGQGKTTFLRMWRQHLINKNIPTIYFNAWENDFSDNAWVCLIGEISAAISEFSEIQGKAKEYLERAKSIGATLLKKAVPAAVKIATAGVIDVDNLADQTIAGLAEAVAKEEIDKYEKSKSSLKSFRENLEKLVGCFSSAEPPLPLVFIIDELDRCRPNFAIEVLEKTKHFFSVKNIVFVLGVDKGQLGSSFKAVYGDGLNVDGYLRRFMDFDFLLPAPGKGEFAKVLYRKLGFAEYFENTKYQGKKDEGRELMNSISELFDTVGLTLREQETCCSVLANCVRITPADGRLDSVVLCFLVFLKVKYNDLYVEFIAGKIDPFDLCNKLKESPGEREYFSSHVGCYLEACINCSFSYPGQREKVVNRYMAILTSDGVDGFEKQRVDKILRFVNGEDFDPRSLLRLVKKIELASYFRG